MRSETTSETKSEPATELAVEQGIDSAADGAPRRILVTGGAGFIGSHTCVELLGRDDGVDVDIVVLDDFSNSSPAALDRVEQITGRRPELVEGDVRDEDLVAGLLADHRIEAVIHFAAKKAVGESSAIPWEYYDVNVNGTLRLLTAMRRTGVRQLVFSSSCSLYGAGYRGAPLSEADSCAPTNPYARTKLTCERLLADACDADPDLRVISLRYFNPVGAHESGLLGEDPLGVPNNVMPYMAQVAVGRRPVLTVFGDDYDTVDGTGVRDYIHVVDVADGHRVALEHLGDEAGMSVLNLGTGVGTSVLQLAAAFEAASGRSVPIAMAERRPGDVATLHADPSLVARRWGWRTRRDVAAICRDAWVFQQRNPYGYCA